MSLTPRVLTDLPPFEELVMAPDRAPFLDEPEIVIIDPADLLDDPEGPSLASVAPPIEVPQLPRWGQGVLRWLRG